LIKLVPVGKCSLYYQDRLDKRLKHLTRQLPDKIMMRPISLSGEEYVAIGKVVEREIRTIEGGSCEQMRPAKEALQALAYGNEMRIEGVSLKICS
jgi:hypothetical protein